MTNTKKPMSLTTRVIIGMVAGILTGFAIRSLFAENGFVDAYIVNGLFEVGGQIFHRQLEDACCTFGFCIASLWYKFFEGRNHSRPFRW